MFHRRIRVFAFPAESHSGVSLTSPRLQSWVADRVAKRKPTGQFVGDQTPEQTAVQAGLSTFSCTSVVEPVLGWIGLNDDDVVDPEPVRCRDHLVGDHVGFLCGGIDRNLGRLRAEV